MVSGCLICRFGRKVGDAPLLKMDLENDYSNTKIVLLA